MTERMREIILEPCGEVTGPDVVEPAICPFTVVIDTREQRRLRFAGFTAESMRHRPVLSLAPPLLSASARRLTGRTPRYLKRLNQRIIDDAAAFSFQGIQADARDGGRPLVVPTIVAGLKAGDYSILGHETEIGIERKSLADLYNTIGQHRRRFEQALRRLNALAVAEVVVEADWQTVLTAPPEWSQLRPKFVFRSVLAWKQRYRNVHWTFAGSRRLAEVVTFRTLERWWRQNAKHFS